MFKKVIWLFVISLMLLSPIMASCSQEDQEDEKEEITTPENEEVTMLEEEEEEEEIAVSPGWGEWWDKFGAPRYGGSITLASGSLTPQFDTTDWRFPTGNHHFENLFSGDWTLDRSKWAFLDTAFPQEYAAPWLAESWEMVDLQTAIVYLNKGIYWQNKAPVNGRKFTANDVKHHYDRAMGLGSGYTKPNPLYMSVLGSIESVSVIDDSTVEFKFNTPSALSIYILLEQGVQNSIEAPEAVEMEGGSLSDWTKAVGTAAWMLDDFVAGTSITYISNPNYWGNDERYPDNGLPYVDKLKILEIPDASTRVAGLRTSKLDMLGTSWEQAAELSKTNPELIQMRVPAFGVGMGLRCDTKPFDDIRVRKALQLAIDRKTIADTYYGGLLDGKPSMIIRPGVEGWSVAYDDWPQELQGEYSYNPEKAKQLLAEAGYPDGFKTNIVASSMFDLDLLQVIHAYLQDINVEMEINLMETAAYMGYLFGANHDQMYYWFEGGLGFTPMIQILWRHSKRGPSNFTFNNDAVYDTLVDEYLSAATEEEAKRIFKEACWRVLENHWAIQVFPLASYNVWQPYLKGYSGEIFDFRNLAFYTARLWIDQN
ncbi:MAG: ABC transporter substrate-binding protein [Dehalococcoidales bacterium]|nr:MAG: ABC transporter substrate-binding protein [Dehalococcoidales bacterium]